MKTNAFSRLPSLFHSGSPVCLRALALTPTFTLAMLTIWLGWVAPAYANSNTQHTRYTAAISTASDPHPPANNTTTATPTATNTTPSLHVIDALSPAAIAALQRHSHRVIDANGTPMPSHYQHDHTSTQARTSNWTVYDWTPHHKTIQAKQKTQPDNSTLSIAIELPQSSKPHTNHDVQTIDNAADNLVERITIRPRAAEHAPAANPQSNNTEQQTSSTQWLLLPPTNQPKRDSTAELQLEWLEKNTVRSAKLKGSHDLLEWENVSGGALIDTTTWNQPTSEQGNRIRLHPHANYPYYVLELSQPTTLHSATLLYDVAVESHHHTPVVFQPQGDNTLQLDFTHPTYIYKLKIDAQKDQFQHFTAYALLPSPNPHTKPQWQRVANIKIDGINNGAHFIAPTIDTTTTALQLRGTTANQSLAATIWNPQQKLYFLSQGQAPYMLEMGAFSNTTTALSTKDIQDWKHPIKPANLQSLIETPPPAFDTKKILLWLGLGVIVLLLAWMAWRLSKQMD